ncbi:hypothetical protein Pint_19796 [Pistacia integerrima]|uniref:Uncharacterized protein n=1 Tax=Pistacia integerrima TaxID=434235 RepID=A0ACC0X8Y0_9ROSI|nr:hypothetical protein Pint_19796 [Pistacia integerrima]
MRDLRRSYLDRNLEENASGETAVLYGKAEIQNLRHRLRSKQVTDNSSRRLRSKQVANNLRHRLRSKQGKLQSAVPVPVPAPAPNHEHQMSEDVSVWSTLWRVVKGYLGFCLGGLHLHSIFTGFVVFEAISCFCYLLIGDGLWNLLTGDLGMYLFIFAQFITFIGIIKTSNAFTMSSINRHSDPVVMGILLSVQFLVFYSCFSLEPKNKESIITASVFRLACYTILVFSLSLRKDFRRSPDDLASHVSEDVSIWSTLWRVVKVCHGFCLSGLHRLSFRKEIIVPEAELYLRYPLTGDDDEDRLLSDTYIDTSDYDEDPFLSDTYIEPIDYELPSCFFYGGNLPIDEDDHESFGSHFHKSPDDQSQDIQDGKLLTYLHHKYKNLSLVVLCLISEAISFLLDFIGKGKLGFIVAAFVLALFVFTPTLWVYFEERSNRSPDERPTANVELLFCGIQLLTTLLHLIFELKRVDDKYNLYNLSYLPLAFAFYRVFSAVFAFRKEHENGTRNAAEPLAEVKVSQHDGSRNIMVHMTVTGKPLNMVIDLTMVTCYEQLFRKLRDEMSQAEKVLWGDKSRWNVRYFDISGVTHGLHEDEISWDEFCTAARKIFISRKEVRAVERTCLSRCCEGAADLEVLNRLMRWQLEKVLKQVPAQALSAAQQAPVVARSVASEVKRAGVVDTASGIAKSVYTKYEPTAKELYSKYEPKAEQCAVSTWRKLNQLPLFPQVAQVFVPTAAYCSEKYNETVLSTAEKGYRVSTYLPLVPTKRIAKVFSNEVAESQPLVSAGHGHETDVSVQ